MSVECGNHWCGDERPQLDEARFDERLYERALVIELRRRCHTVKA
jgi:hypothetical protein